MIRRCKVGMRSVLEAFRTPSTIDEQGFETIDHMMPKLLQAPCQLRAMKQNREMSRIGQYDV